MSKRFLTDDEAIEQVFDAEDEAAWQRLAPARDLAMLVLRYRIDHDLSQRKLARLLGVSQPFVAKLESGEHLPTLDTLGKVAKLLGHELQVNITPVEAPVPGREANVALRLAG